MLSDKEKKEILEDAKDPKIRRAFQKADKLQLDWLRRHPETRSLDNYIEFLDSLQEVLGPFPISKEVPPPPYDFRL